MLHVILLVHFAENCCENRNKTNFSRNKKILKLSCVRGCHTLKILVQLWTWSWGFRKLNKYTHGNSITWKMIKFSSNTTYVISQYCYYIVLFVLLQVKLQFNGFGHFDGFFFPFSSFAARCCSNFDSKSSFLECL